MKAKYCVFDIRNRGESRLYFGAITYLYDDDDLMLKAVNAFLTNLGREQIIAMHIRDCDPRHIGQIIVWYWETQHEVPQSA